MARVFITGSTDGLGREAARQLLEGGNQVVLHARRQDRAAAVKDFASQGVDVVVGDLSRGDETRSVADQVNALGRMDAIIHNAGVYTVRERGATRNVVGADDPARLLFGVARACCCGTTRHCGGSRCLEPRFPRRQAASAGLTGKSRQCPSHVDEAVWHF